MRINSINHDERQLLTLYRQRSDEQRECLLKLVKATAQCQSNELKQSGPKLQLVKTQ